MEPVAAPAHAPVDTGELRRRAIKGVWWSNAETLGRQLLSFLVVSALAVMLSPIEFGFFALVMIVLDLMKVFVDDGIIDAIVQRPELDEEQINTLFWINVLAGLLLCAAAVAAAPFLAALFGVPEITAVLQVASLSIVVGTLSAVQQALLRRSLNFRGLAVRSMAGVTVGGGLGILAALCGLGVWSFVIQQIVERAVWLVILCLHCPWRPSWRISFRSVEDIIRYVAGVVAYRFLLFLQRNLDRLLIGLLLGPAVLGLYSLAQKLMETLNSVMGQGAAAIAMSTIARLQNDKRLIARAFESMCEISSLVVAPVMAGLALTAPAILVLVFGQEWSQSARLFGILAAGGLFFHVITMVQTLGRAVGRQTAINATLALTVLSNLAIILCLEEVGIEAIALGIVLRDALVAAGYLVIAGRITDRPLSGLIGCFALPALASIAMGILVLLVADRLSGEGNLFLSLTAEIASGALAYGLIVMTFGRRKIKEVASALKDMKADRPAPARSNGYG